MTTVAWDGKTLAADKKTVWGGIIPAGGVTKITPLDTKNYGRVLFGASGAVPDIQKLVRWLTEGGELPKFGKGCDAIFVNKKKQCWWIDEQGEPVLVRLKKWATGSGMDFALGAMFAGATAKEAVQIAAKLDINTGKGVDTIEFEDFKDQVS